MSIRKRHTQEESRALALDAARALLLESGPTAVTLKAVAQRIGRTHANLLHHFGSAAGLQKALAAHLAMTICATIAQTVMAARAGLVSARAVVDQTFDAFDREGGAALTSWLMLSGNRDALDPIVAAIRGIVVNFADSESEQTGVATQTMVLLALGDALLGAPLCEALNLSSTSARDQAERILVAAAADAGLCHVGRAAPSSLPSSSPSSLPSPLLPLTDA